MTSGGTQEIQPGCVCATLRRATRSVTQFYDNTLRPSGLRSTQFYILAEIRSAGEATITQLTGKLLIDQTTLTRSVALLQRDGLLKSSSKQDRRLKSLQLTKKGEQVFEEALPLWAAAQQRVLTVLGPAAWATMRIDLDRLAQAANLTSLAD